MKNKTPKPRVMWATRESINLVHLHKTKADASAWDFAGGYDARGNSVFRVAVIPLDDTEAIVERAALALLNEFRRQSGFKATKQISDFSEQSQECFGNKARAALTAAGIPCTKRKARK
jgi:hypothetical protein